MEQNKPQHQENEVELVPVFVYIGRGISNFFRGVGNIFVGLGHFFLVLLIFIQRNLLVIAGFAILGAALGWYLEQDTKNLYNAQMQVQPNFKSTEHLTSKVLYFQSLIVEKDFAKLGKEVGVTSNMAESIKSISIEPYFNETELLKEYDDLARRSDTMALKNLTFTGFKDAKRDFDYEFQSITAAGTNTVALNKVMDKLVALEPTTTIAAQRIAAVESSQYKLAAMELQVRNLDSLMVSFQKAVRESGTATGVPKNNFYLSQQEESKTVFSSIFKEKQDMLYMIEAAKEEYYKNQNIINVVSRFTQKGSIENQHLMIKGAILFFLVGLIVAAVPRLWKFLKAYDEKMNVQES